MIVDEKCIKRKFIIDWFSLLLKFKIHIVNKKI